MMPLASSAELNGARVEESLPSLKKIMPPVRRNSSDSVLFEVDWSVHSLLASDAASTPFHTPSREACRSGESGAPSACAKLMEATSARKAEPTIRMDSPSIQRGRNLSVAFGL